MTVICLKKHATACTMTSPLDRWIVAESNDLAILGNLSCPDMKEKMKKQPSPCY